MGKIMFCYRKIGEDFTDEGVWSVLIKETHLKKRKFKKCRFDWAQS